MIVVKNTIQIKISQSEFNNFEERIIHNDKEIGVIIYETEPMRPQIGFWKAYLFVSPSEFINNKGNFLVELEEFAQRYFNEKPIPNLTFYNKTRFDNHWAIGWHHADELFSSGKFSDKKSVTKEVLLLHEIFQKYLEIIIPYKSYN